MIEALEILSSVISNNILETGAIALLDLCRLAQIIAS